MYLLKPISSLHTAPFQVHFHNTAKFIRKEKQIQLKKNFIVLIMRPSAVAQIYRICNISRCTSTTPPSSATTPRRTSTTGSSCPSAARACSLCSARASWTRPSRASSSSPTSSTAWSPGRDSTSPYAPSARWGLSAGRRLVRLIWPGPLFFLQIY